MGSRVVQLETTPQPSLLDHKLLSNNTKKNSILFCIDLQEWQISETAREISVERKRHLKNK